MFYVLKQVSGNRKTGPMPVSTSNSATCPDACPIKLKGCYAKYGPTGMAWRNVDSGKAKEAVEWPQFIRQVKALSRGALWRHNQAGDLNGSNDMLNIESLQQLVQANNGKRGFTYTHYPVLEDGTAKNSVNRSNIMLANMKGFTINLSGNDIAHADKLKALKIAPVVVLMPRDAEKVTMTPEGNKVVICPAENSDKVTCLSCGLCQLAERDYIIGFRAHGTAAKTVDLIAKG
ncbi:hypothetical protein QGX11_gp103 [Pseudomonas phage PPSC2]|uniref:DUF7227 domain-containing protein n=1 Tax=Pseudomonas phage PPSC2 TaxID=2041350 RepID=A0A2R2YAS0_9CAUD|nr:hypothetical protein QGX11_gp103 [Pseudomonas phage PPSC2]ATN92866.1 hypothetical protein PPSC2_103 [Pseudomonas phage PPSC2]